MSNGVRVLETVTNEVNPVHTQSDLHRLSQLRVLHTPGKSSAYKPKLLSKLLKDMGF